MADSAKDVARILFDVLEAHGVSRVVCSPGSRNAPLLIAADARPGLKKYVVIDERSAAFAALGMAMVSREPVAIVCTSGTALLNYAPAVAEAYYQGIPLIVISADRPLEWIDQDDSQTIRQPEALRNFVKGSYSLSDREQTDRPGWYESRMVNDAMLTALRPKQGPVHINVRLSPPLEATLPDDSPALSPAIIRNILSAPLPERDTMKELAREAAGKRVLVVAGFMQPDARLNRAISRLRAMPNVAVVAETISNLHLAPQDYSADSLLCAIDRETRRLLAPDLVISIGGALVSRMLKEYLRECGSRNPDMQHWSVGFSHTTVDCFQSLSCRIDADPARFMTVLAGELTHLRRIAPHTASSAVSGYASLWSDARLSALARMQTVTEAAAWSDLKAFDIILGNIPADANLILSNGTSIRYAQILERRVPHAEYCNRGVSGIDGSTSTAVGAALCYGADTILVTGDTSFAYDLSALQTMKSLGSRLKIILIDNGGGGIFRFIRSTASLDCRERYFCADPQMNAEGVAEAFGLEYLHADSASTLQPTLTAALAATGPLLLHVETPPEQSAAILRKALNIKS